jgi:hypothetical protein
VELLGVALAVGWFGGFLVGHLALFHWGRVRERARVLLLSFVLAACGFVASVAVRFPRDPPLSVGAATVVLVTGLAVMASLFVLYSPLYYTVAASLSVQTLIAIEEAPGGRLPLQALTSGEALGSLLRGRLDGLVEAGNLARSGDEFRLTPRGERIARFFGPLKKLWRLGPGG